MSKKFKTDAKSVARRQRAIKRLEEQLKKGKKKSKLMDIELNGKNEEISLSDQDKERIEKELITLKARS